MAGISTGSPIDIWHQNQWILTRVINNDTNRSSFSLYANLGVFCANKGNAIDLFIKNFLIGILIIIILIIILIFQYLYSNKISQCKNQIKIIEEMLHANLYIKNKKVKIKLMDS